MRQRFREQLRYVSYSDMKYRISKRREELQNGRKKCRKSEKLVSDAEQLRDFLETEKKKDPRFFDSIRANEAGQFLAALWATPRGLIPLPRWLLLKYCSFHFLPAGLDNWLKYGNVSSVDTTFCTNHFNMFLLPICHPDNFSKTVTSFWALLNDQTTESFLGISPNPRADSSRARTSVLGPGYCDLPCSS